MADRSSRKLSEEVVIRGDWREQINGLSERIRDSVGEAVIALGAEGTQIGQEFIGNVAQNSGDWSHWWRGEKRWRLATRQGTGRVDSGAMRDDFIAEVKRWTSHQRNYVRVTIRIGWPMGSPEYYSAQERGFTNIYHDPDTGQYASAQIPGMGVVPFTREIMEKKAKRLIRAAIRGNLREMAGDVSPAYRKDVDNMTRRMTRNVRKI